MNKEMEAMLKTHEESSRRIQVCTWIFAVAMAILITSAVWARPLSDSEIHLAIAGCLGTVLATAMSIAVLRERENYRRIVRYWLDADHHARAFGNLWTAGKANGADPATAKNGEEGSDANGV